MKHIFTILSFCSCLLLLHQPSFQQEFSSISLSGKWRIVLDGNYKDWPNKRGIEQEWYKTILPSNQSVAFLNKIYFKNAAFSVSDSIQLPGSTDEAKIGIPLSWSSQFTQGLERTYTYDGAFWIQKKVSIPADWEGKQVTLFMERLLGSSKVYWDGQFVGKDSGYAYPHQITISGNIQPGEHVVTILVNKDETHYAHGGHHVYSANGASWNGIVGRIELLATNTQAHITNTWIYPDVKKGKIDLKLILHNKTLKSGIVNIYIKKQEEKSYKLLKKVLLTDSLFMSLPLPKPIALWNEFTPNLYEVKTDLIIDGLVLDTKTVSFGMRQIGTNDGQITINGEKVMMRGTLDCGSYPINGYPDMKKDEWLRVMKIVKQYGLNHIRFHTWCPPNAAFEAADEIGVYLQAELPGMPYTEVTRILDTYGNHPSFCMLSLNNERSHDDATRMIVSMCQKKDSRHLYTCTSHPIKPDCIDDFYVSAWGNRKIDSWPGYERIVGITWGGGDVVHASRFNIAAPETTFNYSQELKNINAPVISHEIGQWAMFPRLDEIAKYKGVLRNTNYERIKNALAMNGMAQQAKDLADASGKFSALLYKEEIESALRTPNFGGFQLLDLHDFQGQYISIVGILDGFWDSKGLVTPEKHRQYCNAIAPLLKVQKRVWLNNESFVAGLDIANYSINDLKNIAPVWQLLNDNATILKSGNFNKKDILKGKLTSFENITLPLNEIKKATKLTLKIFIPNTSVENNWDIWVYPFDANITLGEAHIVQSSNIKVAEDLLSQGKKVLLQVDTNSLQSYRPVCFTTIFWNSIHKWPQAAHTMGILCNPKHAVFNDFPTDMHSNWQWWDVTMNAYAMTMNALPHNISPLIQVVDSYITNDKLAYLWECNVGNGKLMVCSINLQDSLENRPASRQLKISLLNYMNSSAFRPQIQVPFSEIEKLIVEKK